MIRIGGLTPLTATDFPGCLSAVVFCQGCPWRCDYCQNPHLIDPDASGGPEWKQIIAFLERRKGLIDAVVFSGGEPTLQRGLADALKTIREMGFRTGLHTSGAYPERLADALPHLDWVGMDVKAPFETYEAITHVPKSGAKARRSVESILASDVECEFRTTIHPIKTGKREIERMAGELAVLGAGHYKVQSFRSKICLDPELSKRK